MQSGETTSPCLENVGRTLAALLRELGRAEEEHRLGRSPLPALASARALAHDALAETRRTALDPGPGALVGRSLGEVLRDELDRVEAATGVRTGLADGPALTLREQEVRELVEQGLADKQIATRLRISAKTVEKHVGAILRKTGARNRTVLARLGAQTGAIGTADLSTVLR
jgi:DNA-binding CsgD family transcriptional regulator